ncbi:AbrB/MazE/SpoVT family DNA-binding domain-containing protein [Nocardia sp. NPDC058658]|uniref:AbrB/MazE/SpoVT family DNA-binding domain-containing protein n=1 Tax=Nocardia sp. NPDC058658 TaxID=3346580 RepID=UPI00365AFA37
MTAMSVRARIRGSRHQVTLPQEIRAVLHVREDDELEFTVSEAGDVTVRGYRSIPVDQAWFFTPEWQRKEQEADQELAAGVPHEVFEDGDSFLRGLAASAGIDLAEIQPERH